MTKIDIYSGFLGAGKTTLIKKMIQEAYCGEQLVLIENEFGEIGIDGGFLQDAGINITEMNSGCICCSLVGDFGKALEQVISQYHPDRIVIEPSGVGKLSDVVAAVEKVTNEDVVLGHTVAVADAGKVKIYMKNFGEFYNNQIETAGTIILSRTDSIPQHKLDAAVALLREHNDRAALITTPWPQLTGKQILEAMAGMDSLAAHMEELAHEHEEEHHCCCGGHGHHEHHHEHGEHCGCGGHGHHEHHHEHGEHCGCGGHGHHEHHHEHGEHCGCGHDHHEHHHEHGEGCGCGHDHHEHHHEHGEGCGCGHHDHHHHHADEVFTSWGVETAKKFTEAQVEAALQSLDSGRFGMILRAKGILAADDGHWIHFDYVPGEFEIRSGSASTIGKLCVIGAQLDEAGVAAVFGV